jgi:hypothetical protein
MCGTLSHMIRGNRTRSGATICFACYDAGSYEKHYGRGHECGGYGVPFGVGGYLFSLRGRIFMILPCDRPQGRHRGWCADICLQEEAIFMILP